MKQGTTPTKKIKIDVDPELIDTIIFTIKSEKYFLHKRYPKDVKYEDGYYLLKLTQGETQSMGYFCYLEAQIKLFGGAVAKTATEKFFVESSIYTEILGGHEGGVDEGEITLTSSDMIVAGGRPTEIHASDVIGLEDFIPKPMTSEELQEILKN